MIVENWMWISHVPFWNMWAMMVNKRHTAQYPKKSVRIHDFRFSHDRWLLIDDSVYLFGASLKDLGKKWFGFALLQDVGVDEIIGKIKSCR